MKSLTIRTISYSVKLAVIALLSILILSFAGNEGQCQGYTSVKIWIETVQDVSMGLPVTVDVIVQNPGLSQQIGEVSLLIEYPNEAMTFESASEGEDFVTCEWESLVCEEVGANLLRITAIADIDGDEHDPICYFEGSTAVVASLTFNVLDDPSIDCSFFPAQFYWQECMDNLVRVRDDATYLVSKDAYPINLEKFWELAPKVDTLPNYSGITDSCLSEIPNPPPVALVDYWGGGVDILCGDSIDITGDLNLNDISNEIADLVLYSNYFLYGLSVFEINLEAQIAASDVNNDGIVLSFRDIVYLYRIIAGDALPFPAPPSRSPAMTAVFEQNTETNTLCVQSWDVGLAGAYLVFDDSITATCLQPDTVFTFAYHYDSNETRLLFMADIENEVFSGPIMTIEGPGLLVDAHTTDFEDSPFTSIITFASGEIDIDFVVGLVEFIFAGGPLPSPEQYTDADCSGEVNIDDVVWVILYIFAGGPAPGDC